MFRRINISAALIALICFFLPWEQVSCGGARDSLSGLDLARHDYALLWLVPLLMLAVLVVAFLRRRGEARPLFSVVSIVSGSMTTFVMNTERLRVNNAAGIISAQLTGWFWVAFLSAVAIVISGFAILFRVGDKQRS
jgi:hypothetical protein